MDGWMNEYGMISEDSWELETSFLLERVGGAGLGKWGWLFEVWGA